MREIGTIGNTIYEDKLNLLRKLSEQLKMPFLQVRALAEGGNDSENLKAIEAISTGSLRLIDAYLMAAQSDYGQTSLFLEPVSISASLTSVAYLLEPYAKAHNIDVDVSLEGRHVPVMAHRRAFEHAIFSLAHAFFDGDGFIDGERPSRPRLILGSHRNGSGLAAGVYYEHWKTHKPLLSRAKTQHAGSLQPITALSPGSAAGVFIADSLLRSMGSLVKFSKHDGSRGLAATLPMSQQLILI